MSITNQSRRSAVRRCGARSSSCCWGRAGRTGGATAPPLTWTAGTPGRTEHNERGYRRTERVISAGTGHAKLDLPVLPGRQCHEAVESQI
uniref:Uncharacterized protein n=1 Tax=Arundo donax TaxID=35708 RepID=A0A0A8Z2J9_ARUDO